MTQKKKINRLKTISRLARSLRVGVLIFSKPPTEGDTITVRGMVAVFKKQDKKI